MFAVGLLIGFIGAGGAGVTVSILTIGFGLPIHTAVGTALAAMVFTTLSGSISHFREGNVSISPALVIGGAGMTGAVLGANLSQSIPEHILQPMAGFALWFLAFLVWFRIRMRSKLKEISEEEPALPLVPSQYAGGAGMGIVGGIGSAFFGVGMAPFIQIGMLTVMRQPLIRSVGSTMLALMLISLSGSIALASHGDVSLFHLVGVMIGMTSGTYAGAKFTRRAPIGLLRASIVAVPFIGGIPLIFF